MINTSRDRSTLTSRWFKVMLPKPHYETRTGPLCVHTRHDCPEIDGDLITKTAQLPRDQRAAGCVTCGSAVVMAAADRLTSSVKVLSAMLRLRSGGTPAGRPPAWVRRELDAGWALAGDYLPYDFIYQCEQDLERFPDPVGAATREEARSLLLEWAERQAARTLAARPDLRPDETLRGHLALLSSYGRYAYVDDLNRDLAVQTPEHVLRGPNDCPVFLVRLSDTGLRGLEQTAVQRVTPAWLYGLISERAAAHLADEGVRRVLGELLANSDLPNGAPVDDLVDVARAAIHDPSTTPDRAPTAP